jgi:membrane-associated phospholipid phosphatase
MMQLLISHEVTSSRIASTNIPPGKRRIGFDMNVFFPVLTLGLASLLSSPARAEPWNTTSNILALALPALAATDTFRHQDWEGASQLTLTLGSTLVATQVLKSQFEAVRPDGSGNDSFPSGHTAVAFAAARFIQKRYGNEINPIALYGAASLTAVARVEANKHYWRDTLAGAALGYAIADYFTEESGMQGLSFSPLPKGGVSLTFTQAWSLW